MISTRRFAGSARDDRREAGAAARVSDAPVVAASPSTAHRLRGRSTVVAGYASCCGVAGDFAGAT